MRRILGSVLMLGGVAFAYLFAAWGTALSGRVGSDPWWAFKGLGSNYPVDVGYLAGAVWLLALGIYFIWTESGSSVAASGDPSRGAGRFLAAAAAERGAGRVAKVLVLNSGLLITALFAAYIGAKVSHPGPLVAIFTMAAAGHAAVGLLILILALVEKPKSVPALGVGTLLYLAGTAGVVTVFLLGKPQ
jgi:hypothetical protein